MVEYVRPMDPWLFQSTKKLQKVKASLNYESVFFQQAENKSINFSGQLSHVKNMKGRLENKNIVSISATKNKMKVDVSTRSFSQPSLECLNSQS